MNPIKEARLAKGLTQKALAQAAYMSPHALMRYEQGLFDHVSPNLLEAMQNELGVIPEGIEKDYAAFRLAVQRDAHQYMEHPPRIHLDPSQHPFRAFREAVTMTAVGSKASIRFCILLALNHATVLNYDAGKQRTMPNAIREALVNAGLDANYLAMLETYCEIWHERYGC